MIVVAVYVLVPLGIAIRGGESKEFISCAFVL